MFNKDIDRLFQEKFKDFEVNPNPKVWSKIDKQLKPKINFLNFKIVAVVASVISILSIWYIMDANPIPLVKENKQAVKQNKPTPTKNNFTISNQKKVKNYTNSNKSNSKVTNSNINSTTNVSNQTKNRKHKGEKVSKESLLVLSTIKTVALNKKTNTIGAKNDIKLAKQSYVNSDVVVMNTKIKKQPKTNYKNLLLSNNDSQNIEFKLVALKPVVLIKNQFILKEIQLPKKDIQSTINSVAKDTKSDIAKWEIGTVIAPIYYASMTKGSPISNDIANNKKTSSNSYAYGLNVAYNLNKKWSVKTGVRKTNLSYLTKDVGVVFQVISNANFNNDNYRFMSYGEMDNTTDVTFLGDLKQELKYIEIPLEIKYTLIERKIGLSLNGGISTLFLDENSITFERALNSTFNLGEALNVNKTSYSINLGLDTKLSLSKALKYSVSPMFKYHLNTFSKNSGGFKPYSIGINTGLYYSF